MEYSTYYICSKCEHKNYINDPSRKDGLWCFVPTKCEKCGDITIVETFKGNKEPRKMQDKTRDLQLFILRTFHKEEPPLTIRHVFYVCANHRLVPKDISGYRAVCYQIGIMRDAGTLPYSWVADNSRTIYKPTMYSGIKEATKLMHEYYRRDLWASQKEYVEIWVEKDAMAGVLAQVTNEFGVPLYVARGYSSSSFIWKSAETIKEIGKPTTIYQFGDFDYDGIQAAYSIPKKLREEHGVRVEFERVAVTNEQIKDYNLPTRPPKLPGDNAPKKNWDYDYCVDLDAMPAKLVRDLVRDCITQHIDQRAWQRELEIEEQEKLDLWEKVIKTNDDKNFRASTKVFSMLTGDTEEEEEEETAHQLSEYDLELARILKENDPELYERVWNGELSLKSALKKSSMTFLTRPHPSKYIVPNAREILRAMNYDGSYTELERLCRLNPLEQVAAAELLSLGRAETVEEAKRIIEYLRSKA